MATDKKRRLNKLYKHCDRCGHATLFFEPVRPGIGGTVYVLCPVCYAEIRAKEDRLEVLEGLLEAIERLAEPVERR